MTKDEEKAAEVLLAAIVSAVPGDRGPRILQYRTFVMACNVRERGLVDGWDGPDNSWDNTPEAEQDEVSGD